MPKQSLTTVYALLGFLILPSSSGIIGQPQSLTQDKPVGGVVLGRIALDQKLAAGLPVVLLSCEEKKTDNGPPYSTSTVTDSDGQFRFDAIPPGRYCIDAFLPSSTGQSRLGYLEKTFSIAEGETVEAIDMTFKKGGVITGQITDGDQMSAIEASVTIYRADGSANAAPRQYKQVLTDDRGIYRVYGLPPGKYVVSAGAIQPGGGRLSPRDGSNYITYYPRVADITHARPVVVSAEKETVGIDIALDPQIKPYSAKGVVVDFDTGAPVPNPIITCLTYGVDKRPAGGFATAARHSNAKGEFVVDGLAPGHYALQLKLTEGVDYYSDSLPFDITDTDLTGLVIRATQSLSISGVVTLEGSVDPEVRFALFRLKVQTGSGSAGPTAGIGQDGGFRLTGLRPLPARTWVTVGPSGDVNGFYPIRVERSGVEITEPISLRTGETVSDVRIVIAYGDARVRGTLTKIESSGPLSYVQAQVQARRLEAPHIILQTSVDARSQFTFKRMLPGTYEITARGTVMDAAGNPVATISSSYPPLEVANGREESISMIGTVGALRKVVRP